MTRSTAEETFTEAAVTQVKSWIETCTGTHQACSNEGPEGRTVSPTRLLKLDEVDTLTIRLVETKNFSNHYDYITLSHCWGGAPGLKLKKENFGDLTAKIDFDTLPRSFGDAVTLTRALGMSYLWIDSLCIIQDDAADWANESAKMGDIYANSILTIAATDSISSNGGLFSTRRSTLADHPCAVKLYRGDPLPKHFIILPPAKSLGYAGSGPLNKRGWVLQERLLSRRLLQCTYTEFRWECSCLEASETFPNGIFGKSGVDKSLFLKAADDSGAWLDTWVKLRERYSDMDLTFGSDKLVAFSGLARKMHSLRKSSEKDYLAGLWRPRLTEDLLWINWLGEGKLNRDEPYRVPSWSWAKTNGRITFRHDGDVSEGSECYVEVLEAEVTPLSDPYGQISAGRIRLEGPLCLLHIAGRSCQLGPHEISMETLFRRFAETRNRPSSNMVVYDEESARPNSSPHIHTNGELINYRSFATSVCPNFWLHWDDKSQVDFETGPKKFYFMPIRFQKQERLHGRAMPHPTGFMIIGLLLEPIDGKKGQYTRAGVLEFPSHFDVLDRSLHSSTVSEERYLAYDGHEQYTIDLV